MSNLILEKKWARWYPKKIFLKDVKNNKKILYNSNYLTEQDFCSEIKKNQKKNELEVNLLKKEAYNLGFKEGMEKGILINKEENILLGNKINNLFLDFNNSLAVFEGILFSRLLKTVLVVSSYVIGKNIDFDQSILLKHIKCIIDKDGLFLKKPKLLIHPDNKKLIEKIFEESLNTYKWELIYDLKIDLNSCKVKSESGDMDATIDARWQELCRLINEKEY